MKKRKGSLLQRMMAVLLSAVLVTGMAWDAAPASVSAQEGTQESVSGNAVEPVEGGTGQEETDSSEQETTEPAEETEPETISANDIETEAVAKPQRVMMAAEPAALADDSGDWNGLHWEFDSTSGTLTVSGSGEMGDKSASSWGWDSYRASIKKVIIESGVTDIGSIAFGYCSALKEVQIPDTVEKIRDSAFSSCRELTEITIPDSVKRIGSNAFGSCIDLTNIKIPEGVDIGHEAFYKCSSLTSITIPDRVTISPRAFFNCSELREVIMKGETPYPLGDAAFGNCPCVAEGTKGIIVPNKSALEKYTGTEGKGTGWEPYKDHVTDGTYTAEIWLSANIDVVGEKLLIKTEDGKVVATGIFD